MTRLAISSWFVASLILALWAHVPLSAADEPAAKALPDFLTILSVRPYSTPPPAADETDAWDASRRWSSRGVDVTFSRPVHLPALVEAFVVDPAVDIQWRRVNALDPSTVRLPAQFTWGMGYTLKVVRPFMDKEGTHRIETTSVEFTFPDKPARISFHRVDDVIERKSRQFVHLIREGVSNLKVAVQPVPWFAFLAPDFAQPEQTSVLEADRARWVGKLQSLDQSLQPTGTPFGPLFGIVEQSRSELFFEPGNGEEARSSSVPLEWSASARRGGPFYVEVSSDERGKPVSSGPRLVQVTDLGLTYRRSDQELILWITRMSTGEPIPGAHAWVAQADGRIHAVGVADQSGLIRVENGAVHPSIDLSRERGSIVPTAVDLSKIKTIVAIGGDDGAFMRLNDNGWEISDNIRVGQNEKGESKPTFHANAFTERGLYRPGDSVEFKFSVREFEGNLAKVPGASTTLRAELQDSRWELNSRQNLILSRFGTAVGRFPVRKNDPLGQWTLNFFLNDDKEPLTSTTFRVEEFIPPRHRVQVSFEDVDQQFPDGRQRVRAIVRAEYFAGGGLKHGKLRWRVHQIGTRRSVPGLPGFTGGTDIPGEPELVESGEATLDATGSLAILMPLSDSVLDGRRGLEVSASAVDFDGRVATGSGSFDRNPSVHVGLSHHETNISRGTDLALMAVVLDPDRGGTVMDGTLSVAVLQEEWASIRKRSSNGDFYWSWEALMVEGFRSEVLIVDGEAPIHLGFSSSGKRQLKVSYETADGRIFSTTTSFDVEWGAYNDPWQSDRLRQLTLSTDRKEYTVGQSARVRIKAGNLPTSALLSIEREKVLEIFPVTLVKGECEVSIPILETYQPNVYVSVVAVNPRGGFPVYASDADTGAPGFSYGYVSLQVKREHSGLDVRIKGAGKEHHARPGERHTIHVDVTDIAGVGVQAEVALGVVDESVLSMTGYLTPRLDALLDATLPLGVRADDLRRHLSLQTPFRALTIQPLTGGGGGDGAAPKTRDWFDPVAFFQGDLVTDPTGALEVSFVLPDTMTEYRVYAVALDDGVRTGSSDAPLRVSEPFYLEPGAPRFLTAGDSGSFHVALFNRTGHSGTFEVSVSPPTGVVCQIPESTGTIADADRHDVVVPFTVDSAATNAKLEISVMAKFQEDGGVEHVDRVTIPIATRPAHVMRTAVRSAELTKANRSVVLEWPDGFTASPENLALTTGRLEVATQETSKLRGGFQFLLRYPHGCIEQTTSAVLPLAVLKELISKDLIPGIAVAEAEKFLKPGVERILSMQTASGGFGYWPGYGSPHPFGTAYATFALLTIRKGGGDVPERNLDRALDYLETIVRTEDAETNQARALATYVLAWAGRKVESPLASLGKMTNVSDEDRFFFLLAAAAQGEEHAAREQFAQLLTRRHLQVDGDTFDPVTFSSPTRVRAIELLALLQLNESHPDRQKIADVLFGQMGRNGRWVSTHDTGWCVAALGRHLGDRSRRATTAVDLVIDGPEGSQLEVKAPLTGYESLAVPVDWMKQAKSLRLGAPGSEPAFVRLVTEYPYFGGGGEDLRSRSILRKYKRMAGEGAIRVGDLVEVELEIRIPEGYDYGALVDPFPAGLVPVNSNFATEEPAAPRHSDEEWGGWNDDGSWISSLYPSHVELRTDRLLAYRDHGWKGRYRFTYVTRAVVAGRFTAPPAQFELMYRPEDSLYSESTVLEVE